MKFEQIDKGDVIMLGPRLTTPAPLPEIGKVYPCYDDGKVRLSRLDFYRVTKIVPIEELPQDIINDIAEEIKDCYWLYSPEQTEVVFAEFAYLKEKCDKETIFIRCKKGFWFGIDMFSGRLDLDGMLTKELVTDKEYGIPRDEWKSSLSCWTNEVYKLVCEICEENK